MQPFRRRAALLASLPILALTGCHHSDTDSTGHPVLNGTNAIATVNGQAITQQQFYTQLQNYLPPQQNPQMPVVPQPAGNAVLGQMITDLLIEQYAKDQGVAPTDAEVDSLYKTQEAVKSSQSIKSFDELLAESGQTADDLKDWQLRPQVAQIKLFAKGQPPVSDADVNAFYAQHKADQFTLPNRAHIKRIVLTSAADAQRIGGQIQKGQPFDSFVSQSADRQFPGGDVPVWVNLDVPPNPALIPPQMIQLIKNAKLGATVGPYAFHGVYYLIEVVDKKQKEVVPAAQVNDYIRFALMTQRSARTRPMSLPSLRISESFSPRPRSPFRKSGMPSF